MYEQMYSLTQQVLTDTGNMENDKLKRIVNRHFIGVVREVDGFLNYEKVDIPQEDILIEEIEIMKADKNMTLIDVQTLFTDFYPENNFKGECYDYLYPKHYNDAYVSGAKYPRILSFDEYRNKIEEKEVWYRSDEYLTDKCKEKDELRFLKKKLSEKDFKARIEALVKKKLKEFEDSLRENFKFQEFIYAQRYTAKLREIKNEANVKMYSTDQIGWKDFEYKVNDDILVYIKTNFGYGTASYFYCNLKYKDINILPYSWPVKYYYVGMIDFIRYTRRYRPRRTSWSEVFEFTVFASNMAKHEPERFIKEWIVDEIEEMMGGMRRIMASPEHELEDFLDVNRKSNLFGISEVAEYAFKDVIRSCTNRDREEYKALPKEKVIAFKAEKITGSLLLLDNLRKLTEIASVIVPYIAEIEVMNQNLKPEIEMHMNIISTELEQLNCKLVEITRLLEPLKSLLEKHKKNIVSMRDEINANKDKRDKISESEAENRYGDEHPDYTSLLCKIGQLKEKKAKLEKEIEYRENFYKILSKCMKRIVKYLEMQRK